MSGAKKMVLEAARKQGFAEVRATLAEGQARELAKDVTRLEAAAAQPPPAPAAPPAPVPPAAPVDPLTALRALPPSAGRNIAIANHILSRDKEARLTGAARK